MSRVLVLAAVAAGFWSTASGQTRWVAGGHTAPRIGIFLDFDSNPSKSAVRTMQLVVAAALASTGAELSWLTAGGKRAETFDELAVLHFRGNCRMEKLTPAADGAPVTLGEADLVSGGVSAFSSVECDQIKTCISGLLGGACARDRDTAFGRAMGRVVAHELYHILGKTAGHSRSGIAKSLQTSFDLIRDNFQFDRQALLWLHQKMWNKL